LWLPKKDSSCSASTWTQNHTQINTNASHAPHEKLHSSNCNWKSSISPFCLEPMLDAPEKLEGWCLMLLQTNKGMQVVDTTHTPPSNKLGYLLLFGFCFFFL